MLTLTSCPQCGCPAEITDCFTLASTDGPVLHVVLWCVAGHYFRMPSEGLPGAGGPEAAVLDQFAWPNPD